VIDTPLPDPEADLALRGLMSLERQAAVAIKCKYWSLCASSCSNAATRSCSVANVSFVGGSWAGLAVGVLVGPAVGVLGSGS
jgi:hypothetical protein